MAEKPKNKPFNRWIVVLGLGISLIFMFLALRGLQPQALWDALQNVNAAWLLAGAGVYFLAVVIIAWRWQFLLAALGHVPLLALSKIVAIGYMGNNVYPLRAGEALRIFLLRRNHDLKVTGTSTTVVVERIFDGIVMLSFIMIGLTRIDVESEQIRLVLNIAAPIFGFAVLVFIILAAFPNLLRKLVEFVRHLLPQALAKILLHLSEGVLEGLSSLRSPLHLLGTAFASYATWAVEAGVYWMVMQGFGLGLGYEAALLVVGTVNLAGLIPASPGQIGVYEFFVSTVLMALGVSQERAFAYAIAVHVVIWLPVTLVGFGFLLQAGMGLSTVTHARELEVQEA